MTAGPPPIRPLSAPKPSDLTRPWAQRVLDRNAPGYQLKALSLREETIGTTTRSRLRVAHDGPSSLPRHWFIKRPSRQWRARTITTLSGLLQTEIRFYRTLAAKVPLRIPRVLWAENRLGMKTTLVLADVTEQGARVGHSCDTLSVAQARQVIRSLASLHARFWRSPELASTLAWLGGPRQRSEDRLGSVLAVPLMKRGLRLAGEAVPTALHRPALDYAKSRRQTMRHLASGPLTLVHHDCHPGNLYWQDEEPGFLDWQLVRIGEGVGDVAYLLATALAPAERAQYEISLVREYLQQLSELGVADLDEATLQARYRAHLCYAFEAMVVTLAIGGMMELTSNLELIRRTASAVEQNQAFTDLQIR